MACSAIVGVSGITDAVQSNITKFLESKLEATCLHWDEFDEISKKPTNLLDWHEKNKNYEEFDKFLKAS